MRFAQIVGLACAGLAACTSSYQGSRLPGDGSLPKDSGVPFMLTRPQFVVQKDDKDELSVSITYVPDPEQRYSLRMSPALLSNVGFKLSNSATGAINGLTVSSEDQFLPTIVAMLKFSAGIAGGLKAGTSSGTHEKLDLTACTAKDASTTQLILCALEAPRVAPDDKTPVPPVCTPAALQSLTALVQRYAGDEAKEKLVLSRVYGATSEDEACLGSSGPALSRQLKVATSALQAKIDETWPTRTATALKNLTADDLKLLNRAELALKLTSAKEILVKALTDQDFTKIRRLRAAAGRYDENADAPDAKYLVRELGGDFTNVSVQVMKVVDMVVGGVIKDAALDNANDALIGRLEAARTVAKALTDASRLPSETWVKRHIAQLDLLEVAAMKAALLRPRGLDASTGVLTPPIDPTTDASVMAIRRERAAAVGALAEYDRMLDIRAKLKTLPRSAQDDRQSRSEEYVMLRDEADRLSTVIATRITAASSAGKKDEKPEKTPLSSPWVSAACVDESSALDWYYTTGVDAPKYVIVLQRDVLDAKPINPGSGTCALD